MVRSPAPTPCGQQKTRRGTPPPYSVSGNFDRSAVCITYSLLFFIVVLFLSGYSGAGSPARFCSAAGLHPPHHSALPYIQYGCALLPCGCARQRAFPHRCPARCTLKSTKRILSKRHGCTPMPFYWNFFGPFFAKKGQSAPRPSIDRIGYL